LDQIYGLTPLKIKLVLCPIFVNGTCIMKRLFVLIALLGLTVGVIAGCDNGGSGSQPPVSTNAPAAPSAPSTNAAK
jgi:hypothetical protein